MNQNTTLFIQQNAYENIEMASILYRRDKLKLIMETAKQSTTTTCAYFTRYTYINANMTPTEATESAIYMATWWRHQMETFSAYWPFGRGIHRSPVNSSHKGQCRDALMISLICVCINGWVNNRGAGDLRRYRAHYDATVMNNVGNKILSAQSLFAHG